jgi:flavodoxin
MKDKKILTVFYSQRGHTELIAKQIHSAAGGDIYGIELQKSYGKNYFAALISGGFDILLGKRPEINGKTDISGYDIIFAGAPVWFMTVAPALISFLNGADFSGKILIPFCTSGGNEGNFFKNFEKNSGGAKVMPGIGFTGKDFKKPNELKNKLDEWILTIGKQI